MKLGSIVSYNNVSLPSILFELIKGDAIDIDVNRTANRPHEMTINIVKAIVNTVQHANSGCFTEYLSL